MNSLLRLNLDPSFFPCLFFLSDKVLLESPHMVDERFHFKRTCVNIVDVTWDF